MSAWQDGDPRVRGIASSIRVVPDFPKPGIMFQDITTLLLNPKAFQDTIEIFVERYKDKNITVVAGEVIAEEYVLEYGTDCLELHVGAIEPGDCALVIDDLIATGGTLCAAIKLLERAGATVVECACVIGIPDLKGRERLGGTPLYLLIEIGHANYQDAAKENIDRADEKLVFKARGENFLTIGNNGVTISQ